MLRVDDPELYAPEKVNPNFPTDTHEGDVDAALASAAIVVDETYRTPAYHNNPMEPHASTAHWEGDRLTVYDSNQGVDAVQEALADAVRAPARGRARGVAPRRRRVRFQGHRRARSWWRRRWRRGSVDRPVKLAATRRQMFAFVGYRTPTIQRLQLGGRCRRTAHCHRARRGGADVDRPGVRRADRRGHADDVRGAEPADDPSPRSTRRADAVVDAGAGRVPGDVRARVGDGRTRGGDRHRPDRAAPPQRARRSTRRAGTRSRAATWSRACRRVRPGSAGRGATPRPGVRRDGRWLVGTGVAASTYPARSRPSSAAASATPTDASRWSWRRPTSAPARAPRSR